MKTKSVLLALALMFGTIVSAFAGNHPALTYPTGGFATSGDQVASGVNPWHKNLLNYPSGIVVPGPWYTTCPGMPNMVLNSKTSKVIVLSNGKHMTVACLACKEEAENNPEKYKIYMY